VASLVFDHVLQTLHDGSTVECAGQWISRGKPCQTLLSVHCVPYVGHRHDGFARFTLTKRTYTHAYIQNFARLREHSVTIIVVTLSCLKRL
jgi:hypothetical protein